MKKRASSSPPPPVCTVCLLSHCTLILLWRGQRINLLRAYTGFYCVYYLFGVEKKMGAPKNNYIIIGSFDISIGSKVWFGDNLCVVWATLCRLYEEVVDR